METDREVHDMETEFATGRIVQQFTDTSGQTFRPAVATVPYICEDIQRRGNIILSMWGQQ